MKASTNQNIAVMLSSKANETSLELPKLQQGVFSYALIKGLKGKADENKNGVITIKELFYYVHEEALRISKDYDKQQTPVLFGNFDLNLIIGKVY